MTRRGLGMGNLRDEMGPERAVKGTRDEGSHSAVEEGQAAGFAAVCGGEETRLGTEQQVPGERARGGWPVAGACAACGGAPIAFGPRLVTLDLSGSK